MVATMAEGGNASAADPSASVMCRLTTKLGEAFAVGGADVGFPTAVTRLGLSRTVNAMLSAKHTDATWDARPFDFLVEGELLRGELGEQRSMRHGQPCIHAWRGSVVGTTGVRDVLVPLPDVVCDDGHQ